MSYPPPPAAPPPGPPLGATPERMPGTTKGAVVLLWIMFGLGICGGGASLVGYFTLTALEDTGDVILPDSYMLFLIASIVQVLIWTVLRGVFAVQISKRKSSARMGAIILEAVGVALSLLSYLFTPEIEVTGQSAGSSAAGAIAGAAIGLAIAGIMIGLLSTADSKRWCNQ
ncbi:hypothetical protein [Glycomyces sp. NPDC048151]|uniref:hypothetical protein n=1 Tax=Glycomyces sp. NPDC048151 TaxID=3364002 RepID=UPI00371EF6E5